MYTVCLSLFISSAQTYCARNGLDAETFVIKFVHHSLTDPVLSLKALDKFITHLTDDQRVQRKRKRPTHKSRSKQPLVNRSRRMTPQHFTKKTIHLYPSIHNIHKYINTNTQIHHHLSSVICHMCLSYYVFPSFPFILQVFLKAYIMRTALFLFTCFP